MGWGWIAFSSRESNDPPLALNRKGSSASTQISPEVYLDLCLPFSNAVNVVVYRIVQEGFTNICKHAQATAVRLTIETTPQALTLPRKSGHSRRVDTEGECSDDSKTAKDIYRRAKSRGCRQRSAIG